MNEPDRASEQSSPASMAVFNSEDSGGVMHLSVASIATFSHELRNSLGAMRNAVHVLRMDVSATPAQAQARSAIERQIQQMARLVDDLLDVSRIRTGKLRLECARTDLRDIVAHSLQAVGFVMQQRAHRVAVSFPESCVWLHADPARLQQVFVNLLTNAAKYTEVGGDIRVAVTTEAGVAVVRVEDTGIGITSDVLPHVFDLYMQVDSSTHNQGLGLGLPLVRALVESHGGGVTAASGGLGKGSEFTIRLPILESKS